MLPLKDIHLPEAISWWPPAIGWWGLAVLIALCGFLIISLFKRLTRKTVIKEAKKILQTIQRDSDISDYQKLCDLSVLFRRVAISHYPRTQAASLTGQEWLEFLEKPMKDGRFSQGVGRILTEVPYMQSTDSVPVEEVVNLCEDWLQALARDKS